jgi:hypothetical protein
MKTGNRILFSNRLNTKENENTIEFVNYNNNINDIIIYTNEFTESYHVTSNNTDNIRWETDNIVYISHNLSGDVNIILRDFKDNSMFKYSDYKLDGNEVLIVFPEYANVIKDFTVDIYLIYTESNNYGTLCAKEISAGKYISDITYNNYQESFDALIQFINANKNDSDIIDVKNESAHIILNEPNNRYIDFSQIK